MKTKFYELVKSRKPLFFAIPAQAGMTTFDESIKFSSELLGVLR